MEKQMKKLSRQLKVKAMLASSAMVLAMAAGFAQAEPVTSWTYETDIKFSNPSWSSGGGSHQLSADQYQLSWGAPGSFLTGQRSALTVGTGTSLIDNSRYNGGPASGSVNTTIGGSPNFALGQIGTSLTHWNWELSSTLATLTGAWVTDTLALTPSSPGYYSASVSPAPLIFDFAFHETPNSGNINGRCADGSLASTIVDGCPDLFGFDAVTLNKPFQYMDSGLDGILGNADDFWRTYYASIFVLDNTGEAFPLQQLVPGECGDLGLGAGCFGFRTAEGSATSAQFAFAVTTEKIVINVPEPGTLALFGIALLGLGALRYRKSR
jgi:hypothetical protein